MLADEAAVSRDAGGGNYDECEMGGCVLTDGIEPR
jgi:hypothetical protein